MTKKYLLNPFNALYHDDILLSSLPEIQELDEYARNLEDKIAGDFDLEYLTFEFACNQMGFVRNGLLLAKITAKSIRFLNERGLSYNRKRSSHCYD